MVLGEDEDKDHWHKSCNNESSINGEVCGEYEPSIAVTFLQLPRSLGARHTACGIFASDTDAKQEAVSRQGSKEALDTSMGTVRARSESGEDDEDDGGGQKGVPARPVIAEVAKCELTHDSSGECNGRDIALRVGRGVLLLVDSLEHRIDGTNHLQRRLCQCSEHVGQGGHCHALHLGSHLKTNLNRQR